jgi:phage baseplate assembly protein W
MGATSSFFRGLNFPFTKGKTALPEPVYDAQLVKQSLHQIVLTGRNQRVMRPDFGCDANSFVFEPNDDMLGELIRTEVNAAIGRFESRVVVQDIGVARDPEKGEVVVTIQYVLVATQARDTVQVQLLAR